MAPSQTTVPPPIQSLDRGIRLLEVIARSPQPLTGVEVADRAEINRSTAWRLLATLEQCRLLERDETNRYQVGIGLFGMAAATRWGSIARRARPILERLCSQVDATAAVAVVDGGGYEIIDQVDGSYSLSVRWIGARLPLSCTSVGKLILASLDDHELELFLRHPISRPHAADIDRSRRCARRDRRGAPDGSGHLDQATTRSGSTGSRPRPTTHMGGRWPSSRSPAPTCA